MDSDYLLDDPNFIKLNSFLGIVEEGDLNGSYDLAVLVSDCYSQSGEIRTAVSSNGGQVTMTTMEQMLLMKSMVYETFRIESLVPL